MVPTRSCLEPLFACLSRQSSFHPAHRRVHIPAKKVCAQGTNSLRCWGRGRRKLLIGQFLTDVCPTANKQRRWDSPYNPEVGKGRGDRSQVNSEGL